MLNEKIVTYLDEPVGMLWQNLQRQCVGDGEFFISAPLSSTPLPIYEWVINHVQQFARWDKVRFVLMDEMMDGKKYVPLDDSASYEKFARKYLLEPLKKVIGFDIPVIKPDIDHIADFRPRIDLLILAMGVQGNYANVMPGTSKEIGWHIAKLTAEYRIAHTSSMSRSFPHAHFRDYGMSLGPRQVLDAGQVAVIVSGKKKRDLAHKLKQSAFFDPQFPLSIVHERAKGCEADFFITTDAL